jgi:hypothetical protein
VEGSCEHSNELSGYSKDWNFLTSRAAIKLCRSTLLHGVHSVGYATCEIMYLVLHCTVRKHKRSLYAPSLITGYWRRCVDQPPAQALCCTMLIWWPTEFEYTFGSEWIGVRSKSENKAQFPRDKRNIYVHPVRQQRNRRFIILCRITTKKSQFKQNKLFHECLS